MRPLRFSINLTVDGCYDHRVGLPDADTHRHAMEGIEAVDALLFGRVTYQLMETAWRPPGLIAEMPDWVKPFAATIDAAKKYVVSNTLKSVDWNADLIRGDDMEKSVRELKKQPGRGIGVGGVKLAQSLTELALIDEYEILFHPRIAGHGPTLFGGLSKMVDLKLINRKEFQSGVVALTYVPKPA